MVENVTAVILAGGKGKRLRSVVSDRPKPIALINQRPFLDYLLDIIQHAGLNRVVICTGYKGEKIKHQYGSVYKSLHIDYSHEEISLGTGGAVKKALNKCQKDLLMVFNGDSYLNVDLINFFQWHSRRNICCSMALAEVSDKGRYGSVSVDYSGKITAFLEKEEPAQSGSINAGIYILPQNLLELLPDIEVFSLEYDLLPLLVERGALYGYKCGGEFIDIGTPETYRNAEVFFKKLMTR